MISLALTAVSSLVSARLVAVRLTMAWRSDAVVVARQAIASAVSC